MPKRETTEGLLAKFDEVVVENSLNIAEADLGFCERMQRLYDEKVSELSLWEEKLTTLKNDMPHPDFISIKTYSSYNRKEVNKDLYSKSGELDSNPFLRYGFSLLYDLLWLENSKKDATSRNANMNK